LADLVPDARDEVAARMADLRQPAPIEVQRIDLGSGEPIFVLGGIRIEGASAFEAGDIESAWRSLVGQPVSLADLEAIAADITAIYRRTGFILSQAYVPAQTIEEGVATIEIVEGFVDRLEVAGGGSAGRQSASRLFARVPDGRPANIATIERAVLLSRDLLGGSVETVLQPSPAVLGAADMTVVLERKPIAGFAALDNRSSRRFGRATGSAGVSLFGLLGGAERLDILVSGDLEHGRTLFGRADLGVPLLGLEAPADGAILGLRVEGGRGAPSVGTPGLRVVSEEIAVVSDFRLPLIRSREQNLSVRAALEWRRSDSETTLAGQGFRSRDSLVVAEAGLSWDRVDRVGGVNVIDVGLRQGIAIGSASVSGDPAFAGRPDFIRAFGRVARLQRLGGDLSLYAEAIWQLSGGILPGGERFGLGGGTIGRGFAPGNTTGDSGYGVRLELRRQFDLPGGGAAAEVYLFGDQGRARDRSRARDGERWEGLASVGIGARIDIKPWLTVLPEIVRQLDGDVADRAGRRRETRFLVGAVARF
jgi:hemolysin activation/secretion protein